METIKTWMVSDLNGRNLFHFEIFKQDGIILFDSNLVFRNEHNTIIECIELLISNHLPTETIDVVAAKLFTSVKRIKYYEQFFFDDSVLDKSGKLNANSYKLIQQLNYEKLKSDGEYDVPISLTSYGDLFAVMNNQFCIHRKKIIHDSTRITKIEFESYLVNEDLKTQYVNVYDTANKFYRHKSVDEGYDTYYILKATTLLLAFRTK